MTLTYLHRLTLVIALAFPTISSAEDAMMQFSLSDPSRWTYLSDQVMGGVSEGNVTFETSEGQPVLRLTGTVSTDNRGGFIQARTKLDLPLVAGLQGVILNVRGNNQTYFIHLRTTGTLLPWQYYQAPFKVSSDWQEVRIPFSAFTASGRLLRRTPAVEALRSLAVVAFGREHTADLSVRAVGFY